MKRQTIFHLFYNTNVNVVLSKLLILLFLYRVFFNVVQLRSPQSLYWRNIWLDLRRQNWIYIIVSKVGQSLGHDCAANGW